jgi:Tfp pilus assembly protein PilV
MSVRGIRYGVALIEALIALVVMGFGILALVGVQATLRQNSDVARQRAEATRIATDEMELVRSFVAVAPVAGQPGVSWDELASRTVDPVPLPAGASNSSYRLVRTVTTQGATQKSVNVVVSWTDRTGTAQSVSFDTVVTAASPVLSALLLVPTQPSAIAQRSGRHPTIPPQAVDLGGGQSAFKPVESGTVAWVFDNLTGLIVSLCSGTAAAPRAARTGANLGLCVPTSATLLAGTVTFNLRGASTVVSADPTKSVFKPVAGGTVAWVLNNAARTLGQIESVTAASSTASLANGTDVMSPWAGPAPVLPQAVSPFDSAADPGYVLVAADSDTSNPAAPIAWPQLNFGVTLQAGSTNVSSSICYSNAPPTAAAVNTQTPATYYCAVTAADATGWGGEFDLTPLGYSDSNGVAWTTGTTSTTYRVCRYTTAATDYTANSDHPRYYCKVSGAACTAKVTTNLVNQNFLVIAGSKSCPTDVAANPSTGDLVNSNTLQHQP